MGEIIKKFICLVALTLLVYGCGKPKNIRHEEVHYMEPGFWKYCRWDGHIETCVWENVICTRNWLRPRENPQCQRNAIGL